MKKIALLSIIIISFSCSKTDCEIEPISESVLNPKNFKGNFVFKNQTGELDTLELLQSTNVIQTYSVKSLTNVEECGHTVVFDYDSKKGFGTVGFRLYKDENKIYNLLTNGFCFDREKEFVQENISQNSTFTINVDSCRNSKFKEISFKNFGFDNYKTRNGDIWKLVKFIPGNEKYK
jgi:hypothetical protein